MNIDVAIVAQQARIPRYHSASTRARRSDLQLLVFIEIWCHFVTKMSAVSVPIFASKYAFFSGSLYCIPYFVTFHNISKILVFQYNFDINKSGHWQISTNQDKTPGPDKAENGAIHLWTKIRNDTRYFDTPSILSFFLKQVEKRRNSSTKQKDASRNVLVTTRQNTKY